MESTQAVGAQEYKPEPSLEALLKKFEDAFNRRDAREVASCWAEDGTLMSPTGEMGRGRAGVETVYRHDSDSFLEGTRSRFTITSARRLGQDLALFDADHEVQNARRPDGTRGTMTAHVVLLGKKVGSGWQWLDVRPYLFTPRPPSVH